MEKRVFLMILVVIIGVLLGVSIVTKQAREPLLREIIQRQGTMFEIQNRIERGLNSRQGFVGSGDTQVAALLQKQQELEARVTTLEATLQGVQGFARQAQAQGGGEDFRQAPPPEDFSKVYDIAVAHTPVKGKADSPITIAEFADFQCPFCARFHPPVNEALKAYPNKVNYILKNFPLSFHPNARPAAKAAFAAGEQGKYYEMVDLLLENGNNLSEEKYSELAGTLGLNVDKFKDDYKNKDAQWEDYIQKDMALAEQVGVRGTPTFFINGRKTSARDFNSLKSEIDKILSDQK
jgi:protein-disulfide isomerase